MLLVVYSSAWANHMIYSDGIIIRAYYNRVQQDYSKFLSFCVSEDGFYWSYDDNDSMVYVLSATGERWFRMKK